jgi:hypothetical protein
MIDNKEGVFLAATRILAANKINYWICNGTLLGIIRDSKLIPWDEDIDIAIYGTEERDKIIQIFSASNFNLIDDGNSSDYITFLYQNVKVDINFFIHRGSFLSSLWKVTKNEGTIFQFIRIMSKFRIKIPKYKIFWKLEGYKVPSDFIFPLSTMNYGADIVSVPNSPRDTLEFTYGPDWNIPKPNYNWRKEGANNAEN